MQTLLVAAQAVQVVVQTGMVVAKSVSTEAVVGDPHAKIRLPCCECGGKACKHEDLATLEAERNPLET